MHNTQGIHGTANLPPAKRVEAILKANPFVIHSAITLEPIVGPIKRLPLILAKLAQKGILAVAVLDTDPKKVVYRYPRRS